METRQVFGNLTRLRIEDMTTTDTVRVVPAQPRANAQVKFADGRIYEGPLWTELRHFVDAAGAEKPWPFPIVAALIDNELRELTYHIDRDVEVAALGTDDRDGSRFAGWWRHVLRHLSVRLLDDDEKLADHGLVHLLVPTPTNLSCPVA